MGVLIQLPFQAQQQAVLLPAELAGRLASRVLARTIRGTIPRNGGRSNSATVILLTLHSLASLSITLQVLHCIFFKSLVAEELHISLVMSCTCNSCVSTVYTQ